jgi:hypothetical protein
MSVTVYLSIGNSDDKLTQMQWADFVRDIERDVLPGAVQVHGNWRSLPDDPWQNACWCMVFEDEHTAKDAATEAARIRQRYGRDSVAWAVAETEFI